MKTLFLPLLVFALSLCTVSLSNAAVVVSVNQAALLDTMNTETFNVTDASCIVTTGSAEATLDDLGIVASAAGMLHEDSGEIDNPMASENAKRCSGDCLMIEGGVETVPKAVRLY